MYLLLCISWLAFFRGAGCPEHLRTSPSHMQSIPSPLATNGSSWISANLASLVKYVKYFWAFLDLSSRLSSAEGKLL